MVFLYYKKHCLKGKLGVINIVISISYCKEVHKIDFFKETQRNWLGLGG